jgi:hypothetical protein
MTGAMPAKLGTADQLQIHGVGIVSDVRVATPGQRDPRVRLLQHVGIVNDGLQKHAKEFLV